MGAPAVNLQVELSQIECCACGVTIFMSASREARLRRTHDLFYCLNGHSQYFPGKSDVEKAREEAAAERQRHQVTLSRLNAAETDLRSEQAKLKQHTQRSAAGTCPCCKRTFKQMARHMAAKHPDYVEKAKA